MWMKQKAVKGIAQRGTDARRKDIIIRVQISKEQEALVSFVCDDVVLTVPRSVLFKVTGGRLK